ncbi:GNAT family N-acetyltransferase [Acetonema longum]|uniref:Acetyltransferase n=1 Tax=Acetonema longum DSM 6540 TaxID=1009370 RepID=F7NDN6_9FIRM|nr:N-acetyltransferase [Acetonema longum]EGO65898.1 acetyltransferase [Acetonema longum DSM 6540]
MTQSMSGVEIKKIRYRDLKAWENLFAATFKDDVLPANINLHIRRIRQYYGILRPLSQIFPSVRNYFNIYIITVNGQIGGFFQVSYMNSRQLHLDYITVSKSYRSRGIGAWTIQKLLERAQKNALDVVLEVKADNPAYWLYKRLGFSPQARILHYEKEFARRGVSLVAPHVPGLRKLEDRDRSRLHKLYLNSVPRRIQRHILRDQGQTHSSLFQRNLEWFKNRLMKTAKQEYAVEVGGSIIAILEIRSYPRDATHNINLRLDKNYESLRKPLMQYAVFLLQKQYSKGRVHTTVYDDSAAKQLTLDKLGFKLGATYSLMVHTASTPLSEPKPCLKERTCP